MLHILGKFSTILAFSAILVAVVSSQAPPPTGITGAGTASAADLMADWAKNFWYESAGLVDLRYDPVGSIDGFDKLTASVSRNANLTFAVRDYPVSDMDKGNLETGYGKQVLHFPMALEGIAVAFNLPAGTIPPGQRLRLTRAAVGKIYAGDITKWNDPELLVYNNFLSTLGDLDIQPVGRSDRCGTSYAFTTWLSVAGAIRASDQPQFGPAVTTFGHNRGVAQAIISEIGSIGYLTYGFAIAQSEGVALLENEPERFVEPTLDSIVEATSILTTTPPKASDPWQYLSLVNVPNAYPVSNILFVVVMGDLSQSSFQGAATVGFLRWINTVPGQQIAQAQFLVPLTEVMRNSNNEGIDGITLASGLFGSLYWPPPPNVAKPIPTTAPQDPTISFQPFGGFTASPPRDYAAADVTVSDFSVIFTVAFALLFIVLFVTDNYHSGWLLFPERKGWCEPPKGEPSESEKFEAELTRLRREADGEEANV